MEDFPSRREEREMDSALGGSPPERSVEEENARLEAALSCGPQCASSVLATRYAKILRQERLLKRAEKMLTDLGDTHPLLTMPEFTAVRKLVLEISDEGRNPA